MPARTSGGVQLRPITRGVVACVAAAALAGCTGTSGTPSGDLPPGGTADQPLTVSAETDLLDWEPAPGPISSTVTSSGDWTLVVDEEATEATLRSTSGNGNATISTTARERISDAFLDGKYAVVVKQDRQETRPATAVVLDLDQLDDPRTIDGSSDVPTTTGGSWALGQGRLAHATVSKGRYCLATVDLATLTSSPGWCAPRRHGFNGVHLTPAGTSLMTFDDARPSCRTVAEVDDEELTAFPGVTRCTGWEGVLLDDGAVWSVVPKPKQIENAHLFARVGTDHYDLGAGTSGTLTWCAGSAYFVRDPQRDGDPARVLRWDPDRGLAVVYESPEGQAFLTAPRCGGDMLSVTALSEGGDEQVSTRLS